MARIFLLLSLLTSLLFTTPTHAAPSTPVTVPIVFVARAHLTTQDDVFEEELGPAGQFGTGLPKFAPGSKLMVRETNGTLRILIDGSNPTNATNFLIDVQAPDVSFDGTKIIFAGATTADLNRVYSRTLESFTINPSYGWRLYEINVDGSGFRRLPIPDRDFTVTALPRNNALGYDYGNSSTYAWWNDLFPAYLADGRIVFASTRYPMRAHYDARHSYNLYVVNSDGGNLHRITTERGGLLHPTPLPDGRILVARWWNNFNQPSLKDIYNRIDNRDSDYRLPDGTLVKANVDETFNPATGALPSGYEIRDAPNTWHIMALNPDGTDFHRFAFTPYGTWALTDDSGKDTYVGAQPAVIISNTQLYIAYTSQQDTTMVHSTLKSGLRVAYPDVSRMYSNTADAVAGLTYYKAWELDDDTPPYALHPWGLPDGRILFSYVITSTPGLTGTSVYTDRVTGSGLLLQGSDLQYQLYTMNLDGSDKTLIPIDIGSADALDAKPIVARVGWSAQTDVFNASPSDDPRYLNLPNTFAPYTFTLQSANQILTATLHNPNIYANAPLTLPYINNSPMPGTVAYAQVYVDANQFTGAYCYGDWPQSCAAFREDNQVRAVLWTQVPVTPRGAFTATVPADVPGFVVLRDAQGRVVSGWNRGYISIAQGSAWARPGQTVTCIGCHFGHVSGSVDKVTATAGWTNIAPYAAVRASSYYTDDNNQYRPFVPEKINDRRGWVPIPVGGPGAQYQDDETGWISALGQSVGEWVELRWSLPMTVSQIRLVAPPSYLGDWGGFGKPEAQGNYQLTGTVQLALKGNAVGAPINIGSIKALSEGGSLITLPTPTRIDALTFTVTQTSGHWWWEEVAALNEIEVLGMAAEGVEYKWLYLPVVRR